MSAVLLDLVLRDPNVRWHPVRIAGIWIAWMERGLCRAGLQGKFGGVVLAAAALGSCGIPVIVLLSLAASGAAKFISGVLVIYFSIALGSLLSAGRTVQTALAAQNLAAARAGVSKICGRDVDRLDGQGLTRATVESVAENSVDAFTAPLFYAALLGPAGAWLYRIVNTLDSMVGYKNEKYIRFGWASAKLDDILNYIPARATALLLAIGAPLVRGSVRASLRTALDFARLHPSPNAGWTESAAAGALGIRLGGPAFYGGIEIAKPFLGKSLRPPTAQDIGGARRLVLFSCMIFSLLILFPLYFSGR